MDIQISLRTYQREMLRHRHALFHQIIYPLAGTLHLELGGAEGMVHQQTFAYVEASVEHIYAANGDNQFLILDLPCNVADHIAADLTGGRIKTFGMGTRIFRQADELLETAFKLIYLHIREGDNSCIMREALVRCLIGSILKKAPGDYGITRLPACRKEVSTAKAYLQHNFAEDITVQSMADLVGLSVSQFHHVFLRHTSETPLRYLTRVRLAEAEKLLRLTDRTVLEIGLSVGYQSPATFSRLFRRHFGQAPAAYRRNEQANKRIEIVKNSPLC